MDAKSKANFINSVAGGQGIPCPKCNTLNEVDSRFCIACGTPLSPKKTENTVPFAAAESSREPTLDATSSQEAPPTPVVEPPQEPVFAAAPTQEEEPIPEAASSRQPFPTAEPTRQPVRPRPVQSRPKQAEQPKPVTPTVKYIEPESVFAEGLPPWDIEPPQVLVRRKRR